jgi:uncharacterized phiE125 gp8 family phage protein
MKEYKHIHKNLQVSSPPAIEPISLSDAKEHLRIDSGTFEDYIEQKQSIPPGVYSASAVDGTGFDVFGSQVLVTINAGQFAAGALLDAKIQESSDNITFTDVTSFAQIDDTGDNMIYELAYEGDQQYIRVQATITVADVNFSANIILGENTTDEDALIQTFIVAARIYVENLLNQKLITQTIKVSYDRFPPQGDLLKLWTSPIQSLTSIKYYEEDDTENTLDNTTYEVDNFAEFMRVIMRSGNTWPNISLRNLNGVVVECVAGFGDTAADVPQDIKQAIKMLVGHFYEHREATENKNTSVGIATYIDMAIKELLYMRRQGL